LYTNALLTRIRDARRDDLVRIGDVFGNPRQLARFYLEPKCQHHNPADRHEDLEPVSQSLFFNRGVLVNPPIAKLAAGVTVLSEIGAISAS
jgi:hypothetical protein